MEVSQLEQMIRWLDEERKRDKATIAALQEQLEQQAQLIQSQGNDIESLQKQASSIQVDLRRTDDYPEMIEKTNRDFTGSIDEIKAQVRRERIENEQVRRAEIEALNDMIADLDKKIRPYARYEEQLAARAAGEQRIQGQVQTTANDLADLSKRTEDRLQSIVYLEEQRRADARRIIAVEGDIPPLRKSIDELEGKLIRLEDSLRKIPTRVDEAIEIAHSYDPRIEELRIADFQREQKVKQYLEQAQQVDQEVANLISQTQKYALLYNQNVQALDGLNAFQTRLEKRQNEIAEMQRLTEERLRRQWEEWQTTFARDWQKRMVNEEDRWRRQDLNNQNAAEQFAEITEQDNLFLQELITLWEELSASADRMGLAMQEVIRDDQTVPDEHSRELRRHAEEKRKQLL
jgi:chromosome segregation ATPase